MNLFFYSIPVEIRWILAILFTVLIGCSVAFGIAYKVRRNSFTKELVVRVNSWWIIAVGFAVLVIGPRVFATIIVGYVSFVALREMLTISPLRATDRTGLFVAYFSIPVQYYLAWKNQHTLFLIFIPLIMFVIIPFVLVLTGNMDKVGRSMSIIPSILVLTVFLVSHVVMVLQLYDPVVGIDGRKLLVYLIILTAFNDVFQFVWGKLLGRRKILPEVSPNKTWEGLVGGVITTGILSSAIHFLIPFTIIHAFFLGVAIGIIGFIGDACMSAIKRDLKLKDTSNLIPGHGGAMDRLDSLVATAPFFYYTVYLTYIGT